LTYGLGGQICRLGFWFWSLHSRGFSHQPTSW
jgi:hypothetical protein